MAEAEIEHELIVTGKLCSLFLLELITWKWKPTFIFW